MAYRVIRKRTDDVWLLADEDEGDDPKRVRVLDRSLGRLFSSVDASLALRQGGWYNVPADAPTAEELLDGVELMQAEDLIAAAHAVIS
jgi:hypothetical protein